MIRRYGCFSSPRSCYVVLRLSSNFCQCASARPIFPGSAAQQIVSTAAWATATYWSTSDTKVGAAGASDTAAAASATEFDETASALAWQLPCVPAAGVAGVSRCSVWCLTHSSSATQTQAGSSTLLPNWLLHPGMHPGCVCQPGNQAVSVSKLDCPLPNSRAFGGFGALSLQPCQLLIRFDCTTHKSHVACSSSHNNSTVGSLTEANPHDTNGTFRLTLAVRLDGLSTGNRRRAHAGEAHAWYMSEKPWPHIVWIALWASIGRLRIIERVTDADKSYRPNGRPLARIRSQRRQAMSS